MSDRMKNYSVQKKKFLLTGIPFPLLRILFNAHIQKLYFMCLLLIQAYFIRFFSFFYLKNYTKDYRNRNIYFIFVSFLYFIFNNV